MICRAASSDVRSPWCHTPLRALCVYVCKKQWVVIKLFLYVELKDEAPNKMNLSKWMPNIIHTSRHMNARRQHRTTSTRQKNGKWKLLWSFSPRWQYKNRRRTGKWVHEPINTETLFHIRNKSSLCSYSEWIYHIECSNCGYYVSAAL